MNRTFKKEEYSPPDCLVITFSFEKNVMSGFTPEDWETDDEELG